MVARRVTMRLKNGCAAAFTEKMEHDILPLLQRQKGFQDEMVFLSEDGTKVFGISLWDGKASLENYITDAYPTVYRMLSPLLEGSPLVGTYVVSNSTFHKVPAPATV